MAFPVFFLPFLHDLDEYKQTLFETTPVMSAYLLAFSVGDFVWTCSSRPVCPPPSYDS